MKEQKLFNFEKNYNNLKQKYILLQKKLELVTIAFKKNRLIFKRLLKNYISVKQKYIFLRKHSTKKVTELLDEINKEKYQLIFDYKKNIINISNTFLAEIEMTREEFSRSFYVDILFEKYLPQPDYKTRSIEIESFEFPVMIKNYKYDDNHIHPYIHFKISGKIQYYPKIKSFYYLLSAENISSAVELNYFQKTDTLITSISISNLNLLKAKKTIEMHKIMLISLTCSIVGEYSKETSVHLEHLRTLTSYLTVECKRIGLLKVENYDIEEYIKDINYTSVLHDIGKMGIPSNLIEKDGPLTEEEREIMIKHTIIGADYIKKIIDIFRNDSSYISFLMIPYEICLYHHERWDGTGYPHKLNEDNIPIPARIISIVDAYDAMRGFRKYNHLRRTHKEALKIIEEEAGKQFDPKIVKAFLNIQHKFEEIRY